MADRVVSGEVAATDDWRRGVAKIINAHRLDRDTALVVQALADEITQLREQLRHVDVFHLQLLRRLKALEDRRGEQPIR